MTTTDCNTLAPAALQPLSFVMLDPTAEAQRAGDLAYEVADLAGLSLAEMADSYHMAFATTARQLGAPIPCACDFCATSPTH